MFDYEEALSHLGMDDLKPAIQLAKTKGVAGVVAPKRTKPKYPMPFSGEVFDDCCRAIVFNGGLFTQCLKEPNLDTESSLCKACEKQAAKNEGNPSLGFISERIERGEDWADPKGRRPVPYTKVMMAKKFTQEEVMAEVNLYNLNFDTNHFNEPDTEKRGRKKAAKKTEVQPVFGEDDDEEGVQWSEMMDLARETGSETSENSKATSKTSKKSKEEKEAEKKLKELQKKENDAMKQQDKMMKAYQKEEEKAAKAAAKSAEKAAKETAKEAAKAEKASKKAVKNVESDADADADDKRSPLKEIQEEKMVEEVAEEVAEEVVEEVAEEVVEEVEEVPPTPPLPPQEEPEEEIISVKSVLPKKKNMKTIVGEDGRKFVYDKNDINKIVYKKEDPTVRVGVLTNGGLVLDDDDEDDEEDEEELSEVEDEDEDDA